MDTPPVNFYSLICSRDKNFKPITKDLFYYLSKSFSKVMPLVGFNSIFEAYSTGVKKLLEQNVPLDSKVILCHDDIEILDPYIENQLKPLEDPAVGFIGVAGTAKLGPNGVWWDWNSPHYMSGKVVHGTKIKNYETLFGDNKQVVVLDGVFLAATLRTLSRLALAKPIMFSGLWDYYDLYYTAQAHLLGLKNLTVPLLIRHESPGEIANRESWHKNRLAFCEMYKDNLPMEVK